MAAILSVAHIDLARGYKGNERQIELLIRELARMGVPQMLICREDSPLPFHLDNVRGLKIQRIHGLKDPRFVGHFRLGRRYKVIHAHEPHAMQWAFIHYMLFGVPYIATTRFSTYPNGFFTRAIFNNARALVGTSKNICEGFEENYHIHCQLIPDCSSNERPDYKMVQRYNEALKNRFVVGMFAPLINRRNGQSVLIDAARKLTTRLPELIVVFVGAGDDLKLLRQHAQGLPNIKFIGFKRNYIDYLAICDACAMPSNQEITGSILLDAMEQSVPVIASNVGGVSDVVRDGESGLLIDPGDAEALADALVRVKRDPALRQTLIQGGHEIAEMNNPAAMAGQYYRIYIGPIDGSFD